MSKLVIVESPTKARTIAKFLGKGFTIESSYGHIRDLPKSKMGIDIEHDFEPQYLIPKEAKKTVTALQKTAQKSDEIILATDEDREGEAIAWHLTQALGLGNSKSQIPNPKRIVFHEITKSAIERALENPRQIDMQLVDAQQARRVLDRLVGYELSPFLWTKVRRGLSAGRVQSVALRLVVEREREIGKFEAREYWTLEAKLSKSHPHLTSPIKGEESLTDSPPPVGGARGGVFIAKLQAMDDKALKKFDIKDKKSADALVADLEGAEYKVVDIQKKETRRFPAAPFITSTLQQEAARKLGMSAKQTMVLAQQLYETGLITYMRTDSANLAESALRQAQEVIIERFGKEYSLAQPRRYKTKSKGAQEAHEAIRPTDFAVVPENFKGNADARQWKLYDLIWKRTLASQMPEAVFDQTAVDIQASPSSGLRPSSPARGEGNSPSPLAGEGRVRGYLFRATGQVIKFDGFIKVYTEGRDEEEENGELAEGELPQLKLKEILQLHDLDGVQHFTQPPPRYTDATIVKALEEYGIGRPSTYAPTISTILERGYVERKEKKFFPTEIGLHVNDILVEHFPKIVDYQFTAKMEEELDEIAEGKLKWQPVIREFYEPFKENLENKKKSVEKKVEMTDIPCPICGKPLVKKYGRFGQFLACQDYPQCKGTKPLPEEEAAQKKLAEEYGDKVCPECGQGKVVIKRGRFGPFLGCDRYPECKYIGKIEKKTGVVCPQCNIGELVEKRTRKGRTFWGCNRYPECEYATWKYPVPGGHTETEIKKEPAT